MTTPPTGNVHAFACGRPHPQVKALSCVRKRAHAGDHQAREDSGRLRAWADEPPVPSWRAKLQPPYPDGSPYVPPVTLETGAIDGALLGEDTETWTELEAGPWWREEHAAMALAALAVVLAGLLLLAAPALLTLLYRLAF